MRGLITFLLFAMVIGLSACNKKEEVEFNPKLYGEWNLIEAINTFGDPVEIESSKVVIFENDNSSPNFRTVDFFIDQEEMNCVYQELGNNDMNIGETTLMLAPERKTYTLRNSNNELVLEHLGYQEVFERIQ